MNFNHAVVWVRNLPASHAFYTQLFGNSARTIVMVDHYARLAFTTGNSLSLHASPTHSAPQVSANALYFECDVDAEFARLSGLGVRFLQAPALQVWNWREAHLSDPDGHSLILFQDTAENRRVR